MMEYRNKIIAELTQLENYARTCFVEQLKLPNGQGTTVNGFVDRFMADLTGGELSYTETPRRGEQILLDACMFELLPQCRNATRPQETFLWILVADWIHDNLLKCDECGEWYMQPEDYKYTGLCPDCQEHADANDPDTIADFMNDLDRCE